MALLSNHPQSRSLWLFTGLLLAGLGSCVFIDSLMDGEKRLAFSHRLHVEELDCTDCHMGAEDEEQAGIPTRGQCFLCHEEGDEEVPPERRIETLFDAEGKYLTSDVYALGDEVIFSHPDHASIAPDCATCHAGIEANDDVSDLEPVSMDDCSSCHTNLNVANDCATCHSQIGVDTPPASHYHNWVKGHGSAFRADLGADAVAMRCDLCHAESSCEACHLVTPPQNHTNFWRRRGHAVNSRMDRQSCAACHRDDFCSRCHEQAIPMNHRGMWGSTRNNHCLTCHFPVRNEGCVTCHKGTPSHQSAAPLPPDHSPALNCRQCHGLSAPLPHVDKGDECTLCHQ